MIKESQKFFDNVENEEAGDTNKSEKDPIISNYDRREIYSIFSNLIPRWHDIVRPDCIFLTATSASPYYALIKAAWQNAYPDEKVPAIFSFDPHAVLELQKTKSGKYKFADANAIQLIGEDTTDKNLETLAGNLYGVPLREVPEKSSRVLLFDETNKDIYGVGGPQVQRIVKGKLPESFVQQYEGDNETLRRSVKYLYNEGFKNIWASNGDMSLWSAVGQDKRSFLRRKIDTDKKTVSLVRAKGEDRKIALQLLQELRDIGKNIGHDILDKGM